VKKIWKYEIPLHGDFELELPEESTCLCIFEQNEAPHMWISIPNDQRNIKKYKYKVIQTGEFYDEDRVGQYIGTFQIKKEAQYYVGHLFRKGF
jgi:hypothetical protein